MKAVKSTVAAVALSLALTVVGAVLSPPEQASAGVRIICSSQSDQAVENFVYLEPFKWGLPLTPHRFHVVPPTTCLNLSGARLSGDKFRKANLSGANLSGADLTGANLSGADLTGANLTGVKGYSTASKTGTIFSKTTICPNGKKYGTSGANC